MCAEPLKRAMGGNACLQIRSGDFIWMTAPDFRWRQGGTKAIFDKYFHRQHATCWRRIQLM